MFQRHTQLRESGSRPDFSKSAFSALSTTHRLPLVNTTLGAVFGQGLCGLTACPLVETAWRLLHHGRARAVCALQDARVLLFPVKAQARSPRAALRRGLCVGREVGHTPGHLAWKVELTPSIVKQELAGNLLRVASSECKWPDFCPLRWKDLGYGSWPCPEHHSHGVDTLLQEGLLARTQGIRKRSAFTLHPACVYFGVRSEHKPNVIVER